MSPLLLLAAALAQASCPRPTFEFVGQPGCVALAYDDGATTIRNDCPDSILLDQSVVLPSTGPTPSWLLAANHSTVIRDLSFFTLGMNAKLFRVRAVVAPTEPCEARKEDTGDTGR
jgi:hypothetical protein